MEFFSWLKILKIFSLDNTLLCYLPCPIKNTEVKKIKFVKFVRLSTTQCNRSPPLLTINVYGHPTKLVWLGGIRVSLFTLYSSYPGFSRFQLSFLSEIRRCNPHLSPQNRDSGRHFVDINRRTALLFETNHESRSKLRNKYFFHYCPLNLKLSVWSR